MSLSQKSKMKTEEYINKVVVELKELLEDTSVPKNVKESIERVIKILEENGDMSLKINKALNGLDEIADDINMQSYTRTQIWNIVSMLEKVSA